MRPAGNPRRKIAENTVSGWPLGRPAVRLRVARAANDNHRTHSAWRRFVAGGMAALFAASLILVGLACVAHAESIAQTFASKN
jgi:hypothetical protein